MADELAVSHDVLVHPPQGLAIPRHGEAGHGPEHLLEEVHHRCDVEELHAQRLLAQIHDLQPGFSSLRHGSLRTASSTDLLRPHHEIDQLPIGARAYLLRQVSSAGLQDTTYLWPDRHNWVSAHHKVESRGRKGQVSLVSDLGDSASECGQIGPGQLGIGRPRLGSCQHGWPRRAGLHCRRQDFATTGLDVEHSPCAANPLGYQSRVAPGRPLLGRSTVEPGEVPAGYRDAVPLDNKLVECRRHRLIIRPMAIATNPTVKGPRGSESAAVFASLARKPLDTYVGLATTYGDAVRVPFGPRSALFLLSRPEHAEHVLATAQDNYVKAFTYRPLRALIGNGLLTSEGEDWRRHRRLIQPLFSRRDVNVFGPAITQAGQRMLKAWDQLPDSAPIDVASRISALALEIVGKALFGADLTSETDQMSRTLAAGQKVAMLSTLLPLPWGPRSERAVKKAARMLGRTPEGLEGPVGRLIEARRRELADAEMSNGHRSRRDLLEVLLTSAQENGSQLTADEVAAEVGTFLLAGHETSANALSWSLAMLSAFPAARARLEDEIDSVLAGREPEAADVTRLPWTSAVIAEAMRLYPPAWTIERDALADDEVAGVRIPAGSTVAVPPYLVHRNPEFWPDPAGFDPNRFMGPAERPRYSYIPFGGGRRACVGQSFAELETVLVLAAITQRYRLELTGAGLPRPAAYVTLRPRGGMPMRLSKR